MAMWDEVTAAGAPTGTLLLLTEPVLVTSR